MYCLHFSYQFHNCVLAGLMSVGPGEHILIKYVRLFTPYQIFVGAMKSKGMRSAVRVARMV